MKTVVYMIIKNDVSRLETWMHYAQQFDYRVILDTGSTDGTWEKLLEYSDSNLIIEQKIFDPFRFDTARNYNLAMIPESVDWCFAADSDEWFQLDTVNRVKQLVQNDPTITGIGCTRLDLNSYDVWNGPPHHDPHYKIHKRLGTKWKYPVYESVETPNQNFIFSDLFFLIHDQDVDKDRVDIYVPIMENEYIENPTNTWNLWFLLYYYNNTNNAKYKEVADVFLKHELNIEKCNYVREILKTL